MELFLLCGLVIVLFLSLATFLRHNKRDYANNARLPPGTMGWPVIGESLEFLSSGWKGQPEKFIFDRLSKYSPHSVFKTSILGEKMVVMCGASSNKFIFANDNKLVQTWIPKSLEKIIVDTSSVKMLNMYVSQITKPLKLESLQRYIPIMDMMAMRHFAVEWESKDEVKVYPLAKHYTFSVACRLFLSIEELTYVMKLEGLFNDVVSGMISVPIDLPGTQFHRGIKASKLVREELKGIIKQRKLDLLANGKAPNSSTEDLLSHLLLISDEDGSYVSEKEIANIILGFLIAGSATTSATCTFIVKYLAELPHIYDAVYKD